MTSSVYINNKYTGTLDTAEDGTKVDNRTITTAKNTDYFVIDFDLGSNNGALLSGWYLHTRFQDNAGGTVQQNYIEFNGTDTSSLYASHYQSDALSIQPIKTPGEWINVTIIYDFSSVDEYGYAVPANWKGYLYFDGVYCGQVGVPGSSATYLQWVRPSTVAGIEDGSDVSTLFKNYTCKRFGVDYDGPMTKSGVLGSTGIDLANVPDLAYTQQNTPYTPDRLIAQIERVGEENPIDVYQMSELDASLKDGDIVTLYRTVSDSIIVDSNANITFKDLNDTVLTPGAYGEKDLVHIAAPTPVDFTAGNIIRVQNKNYSGANGSVIKQLVTATLTDMSVTTHSKYGDLINKVDYRYILVNDYDWTVSSSIRMYGDTATFDLNGHKLTVTANVSGSRLFNLNGDGNGRIFFENGDLSIINNGTDITLLSTTCVVGFTNIGDLGLGGTNPTLFDQRGGLIIFEDVEDAHYLPCVNAAGTSADVPTIVSCKSSGNGRSILHIDNTNFDLSDERQLQYVPEGCKLAAFDNAPFLMNNVGSGGHRQGSMNNTLNFVNGSSIKLDRENFVEITAEANSTGTLIKDEDGKVTGWTELAVYAKNDNDIHLNISDSYINTANYTAIIVKVATFLSDKGTSYMPAKQFSFDVDIDISNSDIYSYYLVSHNAANDAPADLDYTYNVNINCDEDTRLVNKGSILDNLCSDPINITLANGTKLANAKIEKEDAQPDANLVLPEGAKIAYSSLDEDANFVVTTSYEEGYSYKLGGNKAVDFIWNKPLDGEDPVVIEKVVPTLDAKENLYHYEWNEADGKAYTTKLVSDFKLSAKDNLSLVDYIYYNLYVNAEQYDALSKYVSFTGAEFDANETIEIAGVTYYKLQAKNVNINDIVSGSIGVNVACATAYSETFTYAKDLSIYSYLERTLANSKDDASIALIEAVVNYIASAQDYNGYDSTAAKALIEGAEFAALESAEVVGSAPVEVAIQYGDYISWLVKATDDTTVTVAYTVNDEAATVTKSLKAGEEFEIRVKACDFANGITVTAGDKSATVTLASYYGLLTEAKDQAMVTAIYNYAIAAQNYKPAN